MDSIGPQQSYQRFFQIAMGAEKKPFPYQTKLATETWPDLLEIPTGLGKTAAVILAWLYKRKNRDSDTPGRLIYCLPMRVLVEQTQRNAEQWIKALGLSNDVSVHLLMGGEECLRKAAWADSPEQACILIGTQDMLLSRALMRGYGMSRYQWPMHFGLLHNDALWIYDEIQLMGAGLPTTAQLEAFRREFPLGARSRSLWLSATLHPDWLATVDLKPHLASLRHDTLGDEDRQHPAVRQRTQARKILSKADIALTGATKADTASYITALADRVRQTHMDNSNTIVILNRVERAQAVYQELAKQMPEVERLLIHARFRPGERRAQAEKLTEEPGPQGRIIIATQAIEAGVDISSAILFTELAPWSSLVQRFGRCNRYGEQPVAHIHWIDIATDAKPDTALPYDPAVLDASREQLLNLEEAGPASLPKVSGERPLSPVIRRKDLLDLFNTDPDLSGFDVDISMYIRDQGPPQIQVFWRDFDDQPGDQEPPQRDELCPASMGQIEAYLKPDKRRAWQWDGLSDQWRPVQKGQLRPGQILLLRNSDGGYDDKLGFEAGTKTPVPPIPLEKSEANGAYSGDPDSRQTKAIPLARHLTNVHQTARKLTKTLGIELFADTVCQAALWHDVGKSHSEFQKTLYGQEREAAEPLLAKSSRKGKHKREYLRHELASMLAWLEHGERDKWHDLIAYLILAHHGKVRTSIRAMPDEEPPKEDWIKQHDLNNPLYARGIWEGDKLPALEIAGVPIPETRLRLDLMRLGQSEQGASWTARVQQLLHQHGPFQLAWLETLVRIADWRATAEEQEKDDE